MYRLLKMKVINFLYVHMKNKTLSKSVIQLFNCVYCERIGRGPKRSTIVEFSLI